MSDDDDTDGVLDAVADEVLELLRRGENPSLDDFIARFPTHEVALRRLFPSLLLMEHFGSPDISGGLPQETAKGGDQRKLGDYVIVREVGRGGMGVVYEAEQETLGRRVAIKVLSSRSRLNPHQVRRFEREARSIARLEHPAIVPVYGIGGDRNVPFYVMKFVNGQGLDDVLRELRQVCERTPDTGQNPSTGCEYHAITQAFVNGEAAICENLVEDPSVAAAGNELPLPAGDVDNALTPIISDPKSGDFTQVSKSGSASRLNYFKSIARIGVRVAEALHYAHSQRSSPSFVGAISGLVQLVKRPACPSKASRGRSAAVTDSVRENFPSLESAHEQRSRARNFSCFFVLRLCRPFEFLWAEIAQGRMTTSRVVK